MFSFIDFVGRKMYYLTWFLQFMTLLLGNMGFILLGGKALKVLQFLTQKLVRKRPLVYLFFKFYIFNSNTRFRK